MKSDITEEEYCVKHNVKCGCGRQALVFDSWFQYYPCGLHKHLSPSEYSQLHTEQQWRDNEKTILR